MFISCAITVITSGKCTFAEQSIVSSNLWALFSCLAENETECPNCVQSHGVIREIRANNARLAGQHDLFLSEVKENGFQAVASAFGRGALNFSTSASS